MNNYNIFEVLEYRSIYNKGIRLQSVSRAFSLLLIWIEIMTLTFEGRQSFLHFKDNDKASFFAIVISPKYIKIDTIPTTTISLNFKRFY